MSRRRKSTKKEEQSEFSTIDESAHLSNKLKSPGLTLVHTGTNTKQENDLIVATYIENCQQFNIKVDPSIVIALKTGWDILQPSRSFSEGGLLPLMDILKENKNIKMLKFSSAGMYSDGGNGISSRAGAGNSNARVLHYILEYNKTIESLDLSNTGLGNDGIIEIAQGIRKNTTLESLNLSYNNFSAKGTETLREALLENNSIKHLDLSYNGLGFRSINNLVCMCKAKRSPMTVVTNGNYVFEEILNGVSHGVCFLVSIVGSCLLINEAADEEKYSLYHFWSCVLYSFSLMFLFLSSCLFHSFFMLPQASRILQILDHVGISFLIAGSYTPLLLISSHHQMTARFIVIFEWLAALFGTIIATISDLNSPSTTNVELTLFVVMGVAPVLFWSDLTENLCFHAIVLYCLGGASYLVGIPFFILGEIQPVYHVVWHIFVALGATFHWFLVYVFILKTDITSISAMSDAMTGVMASMQHTLQNVTDMVYH